MALLVFRDVIRGGRFNFKCILAVLCIVYILTTSYAAYLLLSTHNRLKTIELHTESDNVQKEESDLKPNPHREFRSQSDRNRTNVHRTVVEIWGKAAIGDYLWKHVLRGTTQSYDEGFLQHGILETNRLELRFYSGPGFIQTRVTKNVEFLVLVLNGRDRKKVEFAKSWLDFLPNYRRLRSVAVVLLGNEFCDNDWILPYMEFRGGIVKVLFIVYDSPLVDDQYFYQWPLGVATYRKFPKLRLTETDLRTSRPNLCNFVGTVYPNSSRERVVSVLETNAVALNCVVRPRLEWQPLETEDSLRLYIDTLLETDLTLSPVGINTECYRIYEAMSCGSVPIVEDVSTVGNCGDPLRLLKKYGAPVSYVKNWDRELIHILAKQKTMNETSKTVQRIRVVEWYDRFLNEMKKRFIKVIETRVVGLDE